LSLSLTDELGIVLAVASLRMEELGTDYEANLMFGVSSESLF